MTCPHTDRRETPDGLIRCEQCGLILGRMAHDKAGQRYTVPLLVEDTEQEAARLMRLDREGA